MQLLGAEKVADLRLQHVSPDCPEILAQKEWRIYPSLTFIGQHSHAGTANLRRPACAREAKSIIIFEAIGAYACTDCIDHVDDACWF